MAIGRPLEENVNVVRKHRTGGYCAWCDGGTPDPAPDCPVEGSLARGRARAGAGGRPSELLPEYLMGRRQRIEVEDFKLESDTLTVTETIDWTGNTAIDFVLQFFAYDHLPPDKAEVSKTFYDQASYLVSAVPWNPELTVALRKLLESKDAAVRASFAKVRT